LNGGWIEQIKKSKGMSEYVISLFIDIRGFTDFCGQVDSRNVATYISKLYVKILDEYFPDVTYTKPMGDGLFIAIRYEEEQVVELCNAVMASCLRLVKDFSTILSNEIMITEKVPEKVGIGITRDSACCIVSDDGDIIDYSGKTLISHSQAANRFQLVPSSKRFKETGRLSRWGRGNEHRENYPTRRHGEEGGFHHRRGHG
jgi:hypothetical protein